MTQPSPQYVQVIIPEERPNETLRQKQSRFAYMVALLILQCYQRGYEVTLGEAHRSDAEAERLAKAGKGIANSVHRNRLAIDLMLFKDGKYLTTTEEYREIGQWWKAMGGTWGGDFKDGNHFSFEHQGVK